MHGLIVDYIGIFDDVARALDFEKAVQQVVSNIDDLRRALPEQVAKCLAFFAGIVGTIWEALSPDPCLRPYEQDYRWLTQVYESVRPPSGNGRLLWHALGPKRGCPIHSGKLR